MRIASDQYVNGARPTGAVEQQPCHEIRASNGTVWAQVHFEAGESVPVEAQLISEENAEPQTVAVTANPSGLWATVPLAEGAEVSARVGYPRLVL